MSNVLVTGGSGFIGTNLAQHFTSLGHTVFNIDLIPPKALPTPARWVAIDIRDRTALEKCILDFQPEYVVHLAARTDLEGKTIAAYDSNTVGVNNLIQIVKNVNALKRVLFASSMYVCRLGYVPKNEKDYCPDTVYGASKVVGEKAVRESAGDSFCWTIVRPTSIWGPWFGTPYKGLFEAIRRKWFVYPKGLHIRRHYGFVLNTVQQIKALAISAPDDKIHSRVFYVADYDSIDPYEWSQAIADSFGVCKPPRVPYKIMKLAAMAGDRLKMAGMRNPPLTSFRLRNMTREALFDLETTRSVCGVLPYSMEDGVRITVEWMQHQSTLAQVVPDESARAA